MNYVVTMNYNQEQAQAEAQALGVGVCRVTERKLAKQRELAEWDLQMSELPATWPRRLPPLDVDLDGESWALDRVARSLGGIVRAGNLKARGYTQSQAEAELAAVMAAGPPPNRKTSLQLLEERVKSLEDKVLNRVGP